MTMLLPYQTSGLTLSRGFPKCEHVRELQRDLRRLGYLETGIDGVFGGETEDAVAALQHDLLNGTGAGPDGAPPVRVRDYNRYGVSSVDGVADQRLVASLADMLADESFLKVPESKNAAGENAKAVAQISAAGSIRAPTPFLLAVLSIESGLKHFSEPSPGNEDSFVIVGLDRNSQVKAAITSRGFGIGQHTLFHHPPARLEWENFILDPVKNAQVAADALKSKFDKFVNGRSPAARAGDRQAEFGRGPLRLCRYAPTDARHLKDCRQCMTGAGAEDVVLAPTQYHTQTTYRGVPVRKNIPCDWPYAVRRYNGGGLNSYHYQAEVLLRVLRNG